MVGTIRSGFGGGKTAAVEPGGAESPRDGEPITIRSRWNPHARNGSGGGWAGSQGLWPRCLGLSCSTE